MSAGAEPAVTVVVVPRERFSMWASSLDSLYRHTKVPFDLVVIAPGVPDRYLRQIREVLKGRENHRLVTVEDMLYAEDAKNLGMDHVRTDWVCLAENDLLYEDGWLEKLMDACREHPADVAVPLLKEGLGETDHFARWYGHLEPSSEHAGLFELRPVDVPRNSLRCRTTVDFVEAHLLVGRREIFESMRPWSVGLSFQEPIDVSLAMAAVDATVVFEPAVTVRFLPPTDTPEPDEEDFYRFRWDLEQARRSLDDMRSRWSLVEPPGGIDFAIYRYRMLELPEFRAELEDLCDGGRSVVLIDDGQWYGTWITEGLPVRPFPERDGRWWGFPVDADEAVAELRAALGAGSTSVAVCWSAWWWLDELPGLRRFLEDEVGELSCNDRLRVYGRTT